MPTNFTLLRLLLALSVLIAHFFELTSEVMAWALPLARIDAVPAFFIISGWIVSASFEKSNNILAFQTRRMARILPLYLAVILLQTVAVLAWAVTERGVDLDAQLLGEAASYIGWNAIFLNFMQPGFAGFMSHAHIPAINPSLWTLKVEVAFYLLLPLLVLLRRQLGSSFLLLLFLLSTLYFVIMHAQSAELARQLPGQIRYFVIGMICERLTAAQRWPQLSKLHWLVLGCLGLVFSQLAGDAWVQRALQPLAIALFVIAASLHLPTFREGTPDISYGVYLLHAPIIQFGVQLELIPSGSLGLVVVIALTVVGAWVLNRCIEEPGIRWGQRMSLRIQALKTSTDRWGFSMVRGQHK